MHGSLDVAKKLVMIIICILKKRKTRSSKTDDTCLNYAVTEMGFEIQTRLVYQEQEFL